MSDPATERYAAAPAPVSLQRVQSFLNTRSAGLPVKPDLLASPAPAKKRSRHNSKPAATPRSRRTSRTWHIFSSSSAGG
jgi:hypothetical protein